MRLSATATATATVAPVPKRAAPLLGALPIHTSPVRLSPPGARFPAGPETLGRGSRRGHGRRLSAPAEEQRFYFWLSATATATATVAPTMGLLPMPRKPIISTWAGTELEPANWASECIRPMVSVMP